MTSGSAINRASVSAAPAAASFSSEALSSASAAMTRARCANNSTRMKLIQAPIDVANAKPTCANGTISTTLKATLTAVPISAEN